MKKVFYILCHTLGEETIMFAKWLELLQSKEFSWLNFTADLNLRFFQIPGLFDIKIQRLNPDDQEEFRKFVTIHEYTYVAGAGITADKFFVRYSNCIENIVSRLAHHKIVTLDYEQIIAFVKFLLWTEQLRNNILGEIKKRNEKEPIESKSNKPRIETFDGVKYLIDKRNCYTRIERIHDAFFVDPCEYFQYTVEALGQMTAAINKGYDYVFEKIEPKHKNKNFWIKDDETMQEVFNE